MDDPDGGDSGQPADDDSVGQTDDDDDTDPEPTPEPADPPDDDEPEPSATPDGGSMPDDDSPEPDPGPDVPTIDSVTLELDEDTSLTIALEDLNANTTGLGLELVTEPENGTLETNSEAATYTPNPDFNGTDSLVVVVIDRNGTRSEPATVTLEVLPINDAPIAQTDMGVVREGGSLTGSLLDNDTDVDGDMLSVTEVPAAAPAFGTLALSADGTFVYQHDGSEEPTDSFEYEVCDPSGECDTAEVMLTIDPANDPPAAAPDAYMVESGAALAQAAPGVLLNDSDPEGDELSVSASPIVEPSSGTLGLNADGSFSYQHDGSSTDADSFTYEVCDAQGACSEAMVTITPTPSMSQLDAQDDAYTVQEGSLFISAPNSVLDNDTSTAPPLTVSPTPVTSPSYGMLILDENGRFNYTHDGSDTTLDTFVYEVCDADDNCTTATVTLTITSTNDLPGAQPDEYTLDEGATFDSPDSVLDNDTDPEGDLLSALVVEAPEYGVLDLSPDGTFSYEHDGSEEASDSFTYEACDPGGGCSETVVTLHINPINDSPVAEDDSYEVVKGTTLTVSLITLLNNDSDAEDETLMVTTTPITPPASGAVLLNDDGTFSYTHLGDDAPTDMFRYEVCDMDGACAEADVVITIVSSSDPPIAQVDTFTLDEGATFDSSPASLLDNDSDPDGGALTVRTMPLLPPSFGTLTLRPNGTLLYVHDGSENFSDSFTYEVCDPSQLCTTALAGFIINPINDPPTATADTFAVDEGGTLATGGNSILDNDTDPEGDTISFDGLAIAAPQHAASFTLNPDGSFTYVHDGGETTEDSFTYEICDPSGACSQATVTITINPVNDPPIASDDGNFDLDQGDTFALAAPGVLTNDSDPDPMEVLTLSVDTAPLHGTLTLNQNGSFSYDHDDTASASDSFVYELCDAAGACDTATVSLRITLRNQPPNAVNDSYAVAEGGTLNMPVGTGVAANDSDPDLDTLTVTTTPVDNVDNGTLTLNANGSFSYTHDGSETTSDSFTYQICDPLAACDTATATFTITPVNDPPVANDDPPGGVDYEVDEGMVLNIMAANGLLFNDTDIDGPGLQVTLTPVSPPANGNVVLSADGSFTYTHNGSETTSDSFGYQVCDTAGTPQCDTATVSIVINPVDDPPVANNDSYSTVTCNQAFSVNAASGVLANDTDGDTALAVVAGGPTATTGGGEVVLNANGSFTYLPPVGTRSTTDTFTYTLNVAGGGGPSATVTMTIGANCVWYVDDDGGNPQADGRSPLGGLNFAFQTLSALSGASMSSGDLVIIRRAATPFTIPTGGVLIPDGVNVVGEGVSLPDAVRFPAAVNLPGITLTGNSATPTVLSNSGGGGLRLAGNNVVAGLDITDASMSATAAALRSSDTTSGNMLFDDIGITGAAMGGIALSNAIHGGSLVIKNSTIAATGGTGLDLNNIGALSVDPGVATASRNMTIDATGGAAIRMRSTGNITTDAVFLSLNSLNSSTEGLWLDHVSGTFQVRTTTTSQTSASGVGIRIDNATVAGTTLTFTGAVDVDTVNGAGISLSNNSRNITFSGATTVNATGTGQGLLMSTNTGAQVAFPNQLDIVTVSGNALNATTGGTLTATNAGNSFTSTSGRFILNALTSVNLNFPNSGVTAGTAGAVSCTNTAGTLAFTNLDLVTTGGTGLFSSGCGTLNITSTGNTINSSNGTGVEIINTTTNITFQSINATNDDRGIFLQNLSSGSTFTVTGTGTAGTGGTIKDHTLDGIHLDRPRTVSLSHMNVGNAARLATHAKNTDVSEGNLDDGVHIIGGTAGNATNVTLNNLHIADSDAHGVHAQGAMTLTIQNSRILNAGNNTGNGVSTGDEEDGIRLAEVTGTVVITDTVVSSATEYNVFVNNNSGSLDLTIRGTSSIPAGVGANAATQCQLINNVDPVGGSGVGEDGLLIDAEGTSQIDVLVENCLLEDVDGDGVQVAVRDSADVTIDVLQNDFIGTGGSAGVGTSDNGTHMTVEDTADLTFRIENNFMLEHPNQGMFFDCFDSGVANGVIDNNQLGNAGVANSGSVNERSVRFRADHSCIANLEVTNNDLHGSQGALFLTSQNLAVLNAHVVDNVLSSPETSFFEATISIHSTSGSASICAHVQGNDADPGSGGAPGIELAKVATGAFTIFTNGVGGSASAVLASLNPLTATVDALTTSGSFTLSGTDCPLPSNSN